MEKQKGVSEMQILEGYLNDDALRGSFNALAGKCFGIDFEPWYKRSLLVLLIRNCNIDSLQNL